MTISARFKASPWDSAVLGVNAFEITDPSADALDAATRTSGHYTVRMSPLASKQLLHNYGFYYCDTLIEPYCITEDFNFFESRAIQVSQHVLLEPLLEICHGAFSHGRFNRDFNLLATQANRRYDNWLNQLHGAGKVHAILYWGELAGFIAVDGNRLVLHAISQPLRGQGLAKYMWSPVCRSLFDQGCEEVVSSISAANLSVVNLYARLGFRFRNPIDLYHRLTP